MHKRFLLTSLVMAFLLGGGGAFSDDPQTQPADPADKALVQVLEAMAKAFNAGDAKALANLWSEKGVLISPESGERIQGRKAIPEEAAAQLARKKGARLTVAVDAIRRITADVASIEGTAKVVQVDELPAEHNFSMILVKQDGKWLIDSLRENQPVSPASNYEQLKELDWMVGEWLNKNKDTEVRILCVWKGNKNFLNRYFTVKVNDTIEHQGAQIVGWDSIQQRTRSWVFDSDGTFGEGLWQRDGDRWTIKANGVLPMAKRSTCTQVITKVDGDTFTWQVLSRAVDGHALPNSEVVTFQRVPSKEKE